MEVRFYCLLFVIPFSFSMQAVYLSSLGMNMSRLGDEAFEQRNTQCGNDPFTQVNRCFYCSRPPNGFTSAHSAKHAHKQKTTTYVQLIQQYTAASDVICD